jgi:hypothetical protein
MTDTRVAGGPPPGWLFDDETRRTRWWDGERWTDYDPPLEPVVHARPAPRAEFHFTGAADQRRGGGRIRTSAVLLVLGGLAAAGAVALGSQLLPLVLP